MSVVYSVEEPAGLALPLRFTLGHFGLRGFVEREKKTGWVVVSVELSWRLGPTRPQQLPPTQCLHFRYQTSVKWMFSCVFIVQKSKRTFESCSLRTCVCIQNPILRLLRIKHVWSWGRRWKVSIKSLLWAADVCLLLQSNLDPFHSWRRPSFKAGGGGDSRDITDDITELWHLHKHLKRSNYKIITSDPIILRASTNQAQAGISFKNLHWLDDNCILILWIFSNQRPEILAWHFQTIMRTFGFHFWAALWTNAGQHASGHKTQLDRPTNNHSSETWWSVNTHQSLHSETRNVHRESRAVNCYLTG